MSEKGINHVAADWWAERWKDDESREHFRMELTNMLPAGNWRTYSDYDPKDLLLDIVQKVKPECRGCAFSSEGLLPFKTGLERRDDCLISKEGYGAPFVTIFPPNNPL